MVNSKRKSPQSFFLSVRRFVEDLSLSASIFTLANVNMFRRFINHLPSYDLDSLLKLIYSPIPYCATASSPFQKFSSLDLVIVPPPSRSPVTKLIQSRNKHSHPSRLQKGKSVVPLYPYRHFYTATSTILEPGLSDEASRSLWRTFCRENLPHLPLLHALPTTGLPRDKFP